MDCPTFVPARINYCELNGSIFVCHMVSSEKVIFCSSSGLGAEYRPCELECQMSTFVSLRGLHELTPSSSISSTSYTRRMRRNGIPSCNEPLEVSDLISEPSTKYGLSICCGVPSISINDGVSMHVWFVDTLLWVAEGSG